MNFEFPIWKIKFEPFCCFFNFIVLFDWTRGAENIKKKEKTDRRKTLKNKEKEKRRIQKN